MKKKQFSIGLTITEDEFEEMQLKYKQIRLKNKSLRRMSRAEFVKRACLQIDNYDVLKLLGFIK